MSLITNHTVNSMMANRMHSSNGIGLASSMQKLATGQRINRGADDPAGLIISEQLRAMLAASRAESNMLQRTNHIASSADAALGEVSGLINDAQSLLVANANSAGMSDAEREANQMQLDSIVGSINRITGSATFNGQKLLDGSLTLGANGESLHVDNIAAGALGVVEIDGETFSMADLATGGALNGDSQAAQQVLNAARDQVATQRGAIGAFQKHTVDSTINSLMVSMENIAAANSTIRDTNYAQETSNLMRHLILEQSSMKTMGIINTNASNMLKLLS